MDTHQVSSRRQQSSIVFSRKPPAVISGAHKGHKCSNPHFPGLLRQGTRRRNRLGTSVLPMLFLTWDHGHTPGVTAPSSRRRQNLIVFRRQPPAVIAGAHKGHKCSNPHFPGLWRQRIRRRNRFVTSVPPMLLLTWDHGHTPGVTAPSSRRRQSLIVFRRKPPAVIAGAHKGHKC
jgi:hypothetical protein